MLGLGNNMQVTNISAQILSSASKGGRAADRPGGAFSGGSLRHIRWFSTDSFQSA